MKLNEILAVHELVMQKHVKQTYTAQTGLPDFYRAAGTANGNWYYVSALESMGANSTLRCCGVNIGAIYQQ